MGRLWGVCRQNRPTWPQDDPETAQDNAKMAQYDSKTAPRCPKIARIGKGERPTRSGSESVQTVIRPWFAQAAQRHEILSKMGAQINPKTIKKVIQKWMQKWILKSTRWGALLGSLKGQKYALARARLIFHESVWWQNMAIWFIWESESEPKSHPKTM